MKNIFRIVIALGVALVIASCEGTGKQKEVEKTADNKSVEAVADSSKDAEKGTLEANKVTFPVEEGKACCPSTSRSRLRRTLPRLLRVVR
jgi:hypothetical protein